MISLGVDIGGSGCKCVAFSQEGKQLALDYEEYPLEAGDVNLPVSMLKSCVFKVIKECVLKLEDKREVKAITISSFGESFVSLDKEGKAISDILLYFASFGNSSFDSFISKTSKEKIMKITKVAPDASYSLSKMLYTKDNFKTPVWKFLFIASYIVYCLTSKCVCDISLACRSLLYDVEKGQWSKELLLKSGIREDQLPCIVKTGSIAGDITKEAREELGLQGDVKIVIGGHDQIVNALGAGVTLPSQAVDTTGTCECITTLFSFIPSSTYMQENNFACVPYLDTNCFVTYAYNISGGLIVRWYRDALGIYKTDEAKKQGKSIYDIFNDECPIDPTDLIILPYLQGMGGTPDVNPNARGLIYGLTTKTRLPEIYKAILEGVTFEMRYNQEKLKESGICFDKIFACGGGARSEKWLQIKADILKCEIICCESEETGAMGSAILGVKAITDKSIDEIEKKFCRYKKTYRPDVNRSKIYDKKYEMFKKLRDFQLKEVNTQCL